MWAEIGTGSAIVGLVGIILGNQYRKIRDIMAQQKDYLFQRDGRSVYVPRIECSQIGDRIFSKLDQIEKKQDLGKENHNQVLVKLARIEAKIINGNKK